MENNDSRQEQFKLSIGGLTITAGEDPYIILGQPIKDTSALSSIFVDVSENVKSHSKLYYTTDIGALGFILSKLTLRCSSLTNAKLNDKMEKERVGVSQFAGGRFIVCFSHKEQENVHFWYNYGGDVRQSKVLLVLNNFATRLLDLIQTDYCLLENGRKAFFDGDDYHKAINQNGLLGTALGLPRTNEDYDLRNCISSIEMFDVEYLPFGDTAFSKDYSSKVTVDFSANNMKAVPGELQGIVAFNPNCLGKQKSNAWDIEHESRILFSLHQQDFHEWPFIDLRLKEEIFRDMTIVLSPWLDPGLENQVKMIIEKSHICPEIKQTIRIKHSDLENTLD